jgi:3-oxoacyl-[acyl-carrier protein] reductase
MNTNLKNKNAVVCGASQGLGLAVAQELALFGANVFLVSRSEERLKIALQTLDVSQQQKHNYIVCDLSDPNTIEESFSLLSDKAIHILVNNAGGPPSLPLIETNADELLKAFQTHLISSHTLAQMFAEGMKKEGYGRIVNILSTSVKEPIKGLGISNTIRAAVANWAKTLSIELGEFGITVNNVLPGYTNTDRLKYLFGKKANDAGKKEEDILNETVSLIPIKRLGEPNEFGAAVAFLCTPAAAYINGVNLPVDGGRLNSL